uniref:Uncharacterized protein n=1 Tax=Setaria digitata TaxID=48799 RepID=A0A915PIW9_9BILA
MECELDYLQPAVHDSDYTPADPWEEDRREAMKQLYSRNYLMDKTEKKDSSGNKMSYILQRSEIRRRERTRVTPKAFPDDQLELHHGISGQGQTNKSVVIYKRKIKVAEVARKQVDLNLNLGTDGIFAAISASQSHIGGSDVAVEESPVSEATATNITSQPQSSSSQHQTSRGISQQIHHSFSPAQSSITDSEQKSTSAQQIPMKQAEARVVSSSTEELITPTSTKVLVWMPAGISTRVSQETSNSSIESTSTIAATTSPTINTTLNPPHPSETLIPGTSKVSSQHSSLNQTHQLHSSTFPTISSSSPSSSLSVTQNTSSSSFTTTNTNIVSVTEEEKKIPSRIPVAKPLMPAHNAETAPVGARNPFPESERVEITTNRQPVFEGAVSEASKYGISYQKSAQFLEEARQSSQAETFPKQTIETKSILKDVNSQMVSQKKTPLSVLGIRTFVSNNTRETLQDGEVDFDKAKNKNRAAADKALDLLLKAISSDEITPEQINSINLAALNNPEEVIITSQSKVNQNSLLNQPKRNEMYVIKKKVESLKKVMKAVEDVIVSSDKKEAYRRAMNLDLVPRGPSTAVSPTTPPAVIDQSKIFLLSLHENSSSTWSEWTNWQRCFCGKQVRTRVCHYESSFLVKGCKGKSYESRTCDQRDNCPTTTTLRPTTASLIPTTAESRFRKAPVHQPLSTAVRKPNNTTRS